MDNVLKGKNLTTYENEEELFQIWKYKCGWGLNNHDYKRKG